MRNRTVEGGTNGLGDFTEELHSMDGWKVACHSCARRRLRCDKSRPVCHKCTSSGVNCPGYDKVFTWVHGGLIRTRRDIYSQGSSHTSSKALLIDDSGETSRCARMTKIPLPLSFQMQGLKNFGLFSYDLDGQSLRYLKHFEYRECKDLVAHDHPGNNPFLQLLPLALEHPFILHILVAISALHLFNITQSSKISMSQPRPMPTTNTFSRESGLMQALRAKHWAIRHLNVALARVDHVGRELVLAAVLFFINFELIDLEASDWQQHLAGAGMLLGQVYKGNRIPEPQRILFDVVISDCFIYHILGSTLSPEWFKLPHGYVNLFSILQRTEAYCYLCCPTSILQIILSTSQLSIGPSSISSSDSETSETRQSSMATRAAVLLHNALNFDIKGWITELRSTFSDTADHESRVHVAFAHRAAACLYILQAVPMTRAESPVSGDDLVADIIAHLSHVDGHNPHFKATAWPSFIAGAETRDPYSRRWLLDRLMAAWQVCPWGYIFTAVDRLKKIWDVQEGANGCSTDDVRGVRKLWTEKADLLVV